MKKCCVCDGKFSCHFDGKPYCNKHYLRMLLNGTTEPKVRKSTNIFSVDGNTLKITTASGVEIIADSTDYDLLACRSWCISKTGYAVARINGRVLKMHRVILDAEDGTTIDHINRNKLDNRRSNLRECTQIGNVRNGSLAKNNTTGHTGIRKMKGGKYAARIMVNRKELWLGSYETKEEAVAARKTAEKIYFGEYAPE